MATNRPQRDSDDPRSTGKPSFAGSQFLNAGGKIDPRALTRPSSGEPPEIASSTDDTVVAEASPGADDDAPNRVVFHLLKDLQKRLDKYLTDRIPFMSRSQLQRLIDEGGVLVNSKKPKASTNLRKGDLIEVFVPAPPVSDFEPQNIPLDVLYEDQHIIVLNKQPDIIVHPARSHRSGTMINALAYHLQHRSTLGGALSGVGKEFARPGVVHRLDRDTSGVIVFAKDDEAHWKLGHQFERRTVDKRYLAFVHGHVTPLVDVIDLPLGPHPSREKGYREKYVVRHDELGKPSVTICRVLAHFGDTSLTPAGQAARVSAKAAGPSFSGVAPSAIETNAYSLVELELKTGRTHQIRVHLSHLGYPIVGDDMYGGREMTDAAGVSAISRQALHAALLSFRHPISNEPMTFTAPPRGDMEALLTALRQLPPGPVYHTPPGATLIQWGRDPSAPG